MLGDGISAVRKRMSEIRKAGWIHTRGEVTADVVGIAAPIFDAPSSVQGSLSLTLPAADADAERIARIGERILVAARRISDALS
jgi:DNA-binding IclR family transcriptional regulator